MDNTTVEKKKGFPWLLACFGVLILLVCMCICCVISIFAFAPNVISNIIPVNNSGVQQEPQLTEEEVSQNITSYDNKIQEVEQSQTPQAQLILSESEILAAIQREANLGPINFNLDITEGNARLSIPFADLISQISQSPELEQQGLTQTLESYTSILSGLNFSVDLGVSTSGKEIILKSVSTGNAIIDALIADSLRQNIQPEQVFSINELANINGYSIDTVQLNNGSMTLNLVRN